MTIGARLKLMFNRDLRNLYTIKGFAHANKDLLIIVADPKTDRLFVTYQDRFVNGKIQSLTGKKANVIKHTLKYSIFNKNIDGFIASLAETLHLPLFKGNQFYQMIDGFLFNIAKSLRKKRGSVSEQGGVPSPFVRPTADKGINNNQ